MPLYDYRCSSCGEIKEVRHGFNDTFSEPCAACGGALARVISPAPILFKGSGFYVTDSRASSTPASDDAAKSTDAPKPAEAPKSGDSAA